MNKYVLMLVAAALIAAAPAYYAFQAQAEEASNAAAGTVDCAAITENNQMPAECASEAGPPASENSGKDTRPAQ